MAPSHRDACLGLLDETERARFAARRHHADLFLAAHAGVRLALSHFVPELSPGTWRFRYGPQGRPELDHDNLPVRFNLSHTDGLFAVALRWHDTVGVDVERVRAMPRRMAIARRFFDPAETRALEALDPDRQRREFFIHWTLKEAYLKARGTGLRVPPRQVAFSLDPGQVRVRFDPQLDDMSASWHFLRLTPTPDHCAALALFQSPGAAPPTCKQHWMSPP